tara:strand:+ start:602 stop:1537 length:936 start_codon:yes stop_codon:yes gene_type:complete
VEKKLKKIVNFSEYKTNNIFESFLHNYDSKVNIKMRVADILPIENSGISDDYYSYALKSHFDFVISQSNYPLFAVEFDGKGHNDINDEKKDELCKKFDFPILRISDASWRSIQENNITLLQYICEIYFSYEWFKDEKEKGNFNHDEPFILEGMREIPHIDRKFPLAPGFTSTRNKMKEIFGRELGTSGMKFPSDSFFQFKNRNLTNDKFLTFIYVPENDEKGVFRHYQMKSIHLFDDLIHADFSYNLSLLKFEEVIDAYKKNPEDISKLKTEIVEEIDLLIQKLSLSNWSLIIGSSGEKDEVVEKLESIFQ